MDKGLFLDRDGVINHDPGDYTYSLDEFVILPTVIEALQLAQQKGYRIILITNQGGIAKRLYTEETVREIHASFTQTCKEAGVEITAIYFSPHHPEVGNSLSRKPGSLMVERALSRYRLDPARSVMIGDRDRDTECAAGAGIRGILIPTNADLLDYVKQLD
ncbi:MAG: D-glycero-alpha-D-manno-heptose-1,7-bisphosphate 7-phosphatase [Flavobacteriales bacterium]|jgi:D-glycero-D-manno-heptose 1,7-bisphosphate phosphatase